MGPYHQSNQFLIRALRLCPSVAEIQKLKSFRYESALNGERMIYCVTADKNVEKNDWICGAAPC